MELRHTSVPRKPVDDLNSNESAEKRTETGNLTSRQLEVLRMIAEGYSTKRIALALNISVKTVESHRTRLMERLNIHDIAGLVRYCLKHGLIKMD
jgi:DNA-binding NarL/FixJ family response regulator